MKTYIVSHLGQELGPYTESELQNLWNKKEILPVDYIFDEEKQDWLLMTDLFDWAQHLTSTSITALKEISITHSLSNPNTPPALNKVERTKTNFPIRVDEKSKIQAKEDPPPTEVILRRPKNMAYTTQFQSGQAKINLSDLAKNAGSFTLKEVPGSTLKFKEAFQIEIRPAIPKKLSLHVPLQVQAGQTINVKLEALDETGHFCPNLDGYTELSIHMGTNTRKERIQILQGLGHFTFSHTRAEKISFEISSLNEIINNDVLQLELDPAYHLQIAPGPAIHMSVSGPTEFVVGQDIQLELQAVDQFGNLVRNFSAKVDIEANKSLNQNKKDNKVG